VWMKIFASWKSRYIDSAITRRIRQLRINRASGSRATKTDGYTYPRVYRSRQALNFGVNTPVRIRTTAFHPRAARASSSHWFTPLTQLSLLLWHDVHERVNRVSQAHAPGHDCGLTCLSSGQKPVGICKGRRGRAKFEKRSRIGEWLKRLVQRH